jgi:hypothetical protein
LGEPFDVVVGGRRQRHEGELVVGGGHEEPRWHEAVKVDVEIQGRSKFLDKSDRPGLAIDDAGLAAAVALPSEDTLEVSLEHLGQEGGIASEVSAERVREGKHELSIAGRRQDAIHEMCRAVGHASGPT